VAGRVARLRRLRFASLKVAGPLAAVCAVLLALVVARAEPASYWFLFWTALLTALIQASFLGIVYEWWLRDDLDAAANQRANLSRSIRDHQLVNLSQDATPEWGPLLEDATEAILVSERPRDLLGEAGRAALLEAARNNSLKACVVVTTDAEHSEQAEWRESLLRAWAQVAKKSEHSLRFVVKENPPPYELFATDVSVHLMIVNADERRSRSRLCSLEFSRREPAPGVVRDLNDQLSTALHSTARSSSVEFMELASRPPEQEPSSSNESAEGEEQIL
jgi:hypothetical protein